MKLLTSLDKGEAIVRVGSKTPILFTVPAHRRAKPNAGELQKLRDESAIRYTIARPDVQRDAEKARPEQIQDLEKRRGTQTLNDGELNTL